MEENRRFSWSDLFIKVILVVIFILFTVWLLSLSNKELSNSLNVLTDDIFSQNIEKMKSVGKEYWTVERLPEKIGDVKTLTLEEMYEKKLILELKDKYGNSCSEDDSYISIEKYDNEYQMKVYLECGNEKDHIVVIMGCYDYCDNDICELKDEVEEIEYEYKKSTGGYWTDYGKWSNWSKTAVSKTDYRQVETKKEKENYSYDKTITEVVYEKLDATCPEGYKKTSDGTQCYKSNYDYKNLTCPALSDYKVVQNGSTCTYSKTVKVSYQETVKVPYKVSYKEAVKVPYKVPYKVVVGKQLVPTCSGCAAQWQTIYETRYKTEYKTEYVTKYKTEYKTEYVTKYKDEIDTKTDSAICPSGYSKSGNDSKCYKTVNSYSNLVNSCPAEYTKTQDGTQCYKEVDSVVKVNGTKDVTYYRYRVREYKGGSVSYKWSTSKEDKDLLNAGYKLTGRTR